MHKYLHCSDVKKNKYKLNETLNETEENGIARKTTIAEILLAEYKIQLACKQSFGKIKKETNNGRAADEKSWHK